MKNGWARTRRLLIAAVVAVLVGVLAAPGAPSVSAAPPPTFEAHGSAGQVYATGLTGGEKVTLLDTNGDTVATRSATALGGVLFRDVPPGSGYVVRDAGGAESAPLTVHSTAAAPWDPTTYDQTISDSGYQYLTTRDGTKLAIDVHLPQDVLSALPAVGPLADIIPKLPIGGTPGPGGTMQYPTVIEYSGYGYADPSGPQNGIATVLNLMGFAVVDVNMRGTGCSGGAYDFFEPLQNLDGYDVIETIARQPWVLHNKVGMIGISYGGISQLFTAQLDPPSLAAISPLSVLDASATTLYPGGILNTGFALSWAQERVHDAEPAGPNSGQSWAYEQIQKGDQTCAANQALHDEAVNLIGKVRANAHYVPAVADPLDPVSFVDQIHMPVFMACQWEDEQTGGHCPELVQNMTGTTKKWFTFTNGAHIDSLDPATFNRWFDFLDLYVKQQAPSLDPFALLLRVPLVSGLIYQTAMGVPGSDTIALPPDPIQNPVQYPSLAAAQAAFEQLPSVRVLFDNGAGDAPAGGTTAAGNPYSAFEQSFATLPVPGTQARTWFLGPDGTLADEPPAHAGIDAYESNAAALPLTNYKGNTGGGGLWGNASQWTWNWQQNPPGTAVSYVSAPLRQDTTVIGSGAVYLWVKSSTPDVDLQATISEVRPDGKETFVQNGWIRASERTLATSADNLLKRAPTLLSPIPTFTSADAQPMPPDHFVEVAIPLYYQGHAYRAGSRLRVTIAAPNGSQPVWSFSETQPKGTAQVSLAYSSSMPSSLVLPVVPGVQVPTGLPACPSLRNQPCRPYQAIANHTLTGPHTPPQQPGSGRPRHGGTLAYTGATSSWLLLCGVAAAAMAALLALLTRRRGRAQIQRFQRK
jgi:predicted acyl esterase